MIFILITLLFPSFIHAQNELPEFLTDFPQKAEFIAQYNTRLPADRRYDPALIDERVLSILQTFHDGYTKKTFLETLNFEQLADEIFEKLKKESESAEYPSYSKHYWEKNQILKNLLKNPDTIMTINVDEYPDLSFSVTYRDVVKKVIEYQIVMYTYTILYEKIWRMELYDTGLKVYGFKTFLDHLKLQECTTISLQDADGSKIDLKLPSYIITTETKRHIHQFINGIPLELLVPYADGLLHSCNAGLPHNQLLRKTPRECKLIPIFAKDSTKLLGLNMLLTLGQKNDAAKNEKES